MIDEARTRYEAKKVGTSSAPTNRQTRSANVKKEKPPPPPKIQIRRKEKQDEPQAYKVPKATGKRKKEQAQKVFKAVAEEEAKETKSEGGKKELRASDKKSKVFGVPTVKSVKLVQVETEDILKKILGLEKEEEPEMIESFEEEDIPKALVIEGELPDLFEIDEIFTQIEREPEDGATSIPTTTSKEEVIPKVIPIGKDEEKTKTQEHAQTNDWKITEPPEKDEEMQKDTQESVQINVEQTKESLKKAKEKQKEEAQEKKVTYQSLTSNKIIDDEEDDDIVSIQGPINMDMLSPT
ncbi:uncharacterized protein LOC131874216 [Cryptomeria japonica]|uniref:uncharacterized protein LOC131874216 n=1 Tax=Cryptomeria japonica TaxID=3369 RepID=UPI0027D9E24F|nr:uncharacterized protein LOC131874216 [Cryptomeria japonica]